MLGHVNSTVPYQMYLLSIQLQSRDYDNYIEQPVTDETKPAGAIDRTRVKRHYSKAPGLTGSITTTQGKLLEMLTLLKGSRPIYCTIVRPVIEYTSVAF